MLQDILDETRSIDVEGETYYFEFDHAALAVLEKNTGKSVYEIYDLLVQKNSLMLNDLQAFVHAGLLKHHKISQVSEFKKKLIEHPGLWHEIKETVVCAFLYPMMPPEILKKIERVSSKKKLKK